MAPAEKKMPSGSREPRNAILGPMIECRWTVDEAIAAARTFVFPSLPPPLNHRLIRGTTLGGRRNMFLSPEARAWQQGAALIVGGWTPPLHTWLTVRVELEVPAAMLKRLDADSMLKPLLDITVGSRRDQWICELHVSKRVGDGCATVFVAPWVPWSAR